MGHSKFTSRNGGLCPPVRIMNDLSAHTVLLRGPKCSCHADSEILTRMVTPHWALPCGICSGERLGCQKPARLNVGEGCGSQTG